MKPGECVDEAWGTTLRNPLARIELAASRLEREARTPAQRAWLADIRESTAELDRLVGARAVWVRGDGVRAPLGNILREVAERLQPALAARRVDLRLETAGSTSRPESWRARRIALALLREALRRGTGPLELRGVDGEGGWGIELRGDAALPMHRLREAATECAAVLEAEPRVQRMWVYDSGARSCEKS